MARYEVEFVSLLSASTEEVWDWALSLRGITAEMMPLARMTAPKDIESLADLDIELGKPMMRSFVLAGGFVPIDRSDLTFVELEPGRRFLERSPMMSMRLWQHERVIEPEGAGTRVTDRLIFEPRVAGPVVRAIIGRFFKHRHSGLRRAFGELASA